MGTSKPKTHQTKNKKLVWWHCKASSRKRVWSFLTVMGPTWELSIQTEV